MKKSLVILFCLMAMISCKQGPSESQLKYDQTMKTVMDDHDELMKDMSKVSNLLQRVEAKMQDASNKNPYQKSIEQLKYANEAMFAWMHDFNEVFPDLHEEKDKTFSDEEYEKRLEELRKQEIKLEELKRDFEESISNAQDILN